MCGIFGMATKEPRYISSPNLKILGMLNESRGRTCCGITVDGEIFHGHDKDKLFTDFAKGKSFAAKQVPVVIGHTRQASTGMAVNKHNAHPFGFGEYNGGYEFVFVHNGTLLNHKELAEQYEIPLIEQVQSEYNPNIQIPRHKIDSEILGEIIYKTKSLKVLSEYNGRAALVWQDLKEPNVVYLYSGKSVPEEGDAEGLAVEERPMNVWIAGRNTVYFSSMPESLEILGADSKEVFQIDYNTVYVVKDGNFKGARKILISRRNNYHTETVVWGNYGRLADYTKQYTNSSVEPKGNETSTKAGGTSQQASLDLNVTKIIRPSFHIFDDETCLDESTYKNKVYSKKLRYYQNKNLISGIYTYIRGYGFIVLGKDPADADTRALSLVNMPFNIQTSEFDAEAVWKPFTSINDIFYYYFINGVMVETMLDYQTLSYYADNKLSYYLTPEKLSMVSLYPVCNVTDKGTHLYQNVYKNGTLFTGSFRGIDHYKTYFFDKGNLVKTRAINGDLVLSSSLYADETNSAHKEIYENSFHIRSECWKKLNRREIEVTDNVIQLPASFTPPAKPVAEDLDSELLASVSLFLTNFENAVIEATTKNAEVTTDAEISEFLCEIITERMTEIDCVVGELREELRDYKDNPLYPSIIGDVNQMSKIINEYIK